jgi:hypothetical protein
MKPRAAPPRCTILAPYDRNQGNGKSSDRTEPGSAPFRARPDVANVQLPVSLDRMGVIQQFARSE